MAPRTRRSKSSSIQLNADGLRITFSQHDKLLRHLTSRLDLAATQRSQYLDIFRYIDQEYYCYLRRTHEDERRRRDNKRGRGVKPVDEKLSLIFAQIDEAVTYLLSVLAPDEAIYSAIAPREKQAIATAFAALMNQHAEYFGHFANYARFLTDAIKYNFGAFGVFWREIVGNVVTPRSSRLNTGKFTTGIVASGNEIYAFDVYNLLIDPSVHPVDTPKLGEFFAYIDIVTPFRLRQMERQQEIFRVDTLLDGANNLTYKYYEERPAIRSSNSVQLPGGATDWVALLSAYGQKDASLKRYELVHMYAWIVPKEFGLSPDDSYQIWRFILGGNSFIMYAEHMQNAHALLPCNVAMPFEDHFSWNALSIAERLIPHQNFASFVMNAHQQSVRKRLFGGLTIYDPRVIPALSADDVDLIGGKVATTTTAPDVDLRRKVLQLNDVPETNNTMTNISSSIDLMQQILPTNLQQQVAGLDRATQYQAAATVQSANRRNLKIAKIINSQAMNTGRLMQYYNIIEFQQTFELLTPDGQIITGSPDDFRDANIQFTLSDGLKGLDKLALIINIKEVLAAVLQSREASAQIDVVAVINYWTSLLGDHTDFSQFRVKSPIDVLPVEQRNLAFQLLQAALQQQQQTTVAPA